MSVLAYPIDCNGVLLIPTEGKARHWVVIIYTPTYGGTVEEYIAYWREYLERVQWAVDQIELGGSQMQYPEINPK